MEGIFEKDWVLNFTHCYASGLLKYSELNNLLQATASEHAELIGFGYKDMLAVGQSWVLSRMLIEVSVLPQYTELITVRTWIQGFTGSRSQRNFELLRNGKVIATASSLWVVFNLKKRRPDKLALKTDHMVYYPEKYATKYTVGKIDSTPEFNSLENYRVRLSDLDIAHHANNVKYMEWCFDTMEPERVLAADILQIEMNFLKELHYNDCIQIGASALINRQQTYCIQKEGNLHFLMQITVDNA